MASITLADTAVQGANSQVVHGILGGTVAQGQLLYFDPATRSYKLAQANSADTDKVVGVALNGGKSGAPVTIQISGVVSGLTGLTVGTIYVLSDSVAGAIMPIADYASGDFVTFVGIGITANTLLIQPLTSSVAVPA